MAVKLSSNISSLQTQRQLGLATEKLSSISEKLSSGMRINKASDDAAGLAIADSLKADTRIFNQGIRNLNDGVSLLNISQGALQQLSEVVTRQMELAEQSANGSYSQSQRKALQSEVESLRNEFNRIVESTRFNGIDLFSNQFPTLSLQAGYGNDGSLQLDIGDEFAREIANGTYGNEIRSYTTNGWFGATELVDFDNDGNLDISLAVNTGQVVLFGNGDGSFGNVLTLGASAIDTFATDVNNDGLEDIVAFTNGNTTVYLNNGNRTFGQVVSSGQAGFDRYGRVGDFDGDGNVDLLRYNTSNGYQYLYRGNGDGTFGSAITAMQSNPTLAGQQDFTPADINNDGKLDYVVRINNTAMVAFLNNGDGTFGTGVTVASQSHGGSTAMENLIDLNHDGNVDILYTGGSGQMYAIFGNGNGTFGSITTISGNYGNAFNGVQTGDYNEDGFVDIIQFQDATGNARILLNNGNGTFSISSTTTVTSMGASDARLGDLNNDGTIDIMRIAFGSAANVGISTKLSNETNSFTQEYLSIRTQAESRQVLDKLRNYSERISLELGNIGAHQSRISSAVNNLTATSINYQAAASILSQANQIPELSLRLIRGGTG